MVMRLRNWRCLRLCITALHMALDSSSFSFWRSIPGKLVSLDVDWPAVRRHYKMLVM